MKMGNISIFKIAALVLALLMSLSAVACGGITPDTEGGEDVVETEVITNLIHFLLIVFAYIIEGDRRLYPFANHTTAGQE